MIEFELPVSKSLANRWMIIWNLLGRGYYPFDTGDCKDNIELRNALLKIKELESTPSSAPPLIDAGSGAACLRFLLCLLSTKKGPYFLTGSQQVLKRPHATLIEYLKKLGTQIIERDSGWLIQGGEWKQNYLEAGEKISSQNLSGILLAALIHPRTFTLKLTNLPPSIPYLQMTLACMEEAGVVVKQSTDSIEVFPATNVSSIRFPKQLEKDWSGASILMLIPFLKPENYFFLRELKMQSLQGDSQIAFILQNEGMQIKQQPNGLELFVSKSNKNRNTVLEINFRDIPDLFPAIVTYCLIQKRELQATGIENLIHKESNRVNSMSAICHACGCTTQTDSNSFKMLNFAEPPIKSAFIVNTHEDHRISMSVNLLKLKFPFLKPDNSICIEKSFPGYLRELEKVSNL